MLEYRCIFLVDKAGNNVDLLISLMPINNPNGEPDYVAVSLPWSKCTERACGQLANEQGMIFDGSSPTDIDEFIYS